jgi:hypothetical protein
VGLAGVSLQSGQPHSGLLFLAALHQYIESGRTIVSSEVLVRSEQLLADVRRHMSDTDFERTWSQGQVMDLAALEDLAAEAPGLTTAE